MGLHSLYGKTRKVCAELLIEFNQMKTQLTGLICLTYLGDKNSTVELHFGCAIHIS